MLWLSNKWKKGCAGATYGSDWEALRNDKILRIVFGTEQPAATPAPPANNTAHLAADSQEANNTAHLATYSQEANNTAHLATDSQEIEPKEAPTLTRKRCVAAAASNELAPTFHQNPMAPVATWGRKPRPQRPRNLREEYKLPKSHPCRHRRASRLSYKRAHIEPLVWQGQFGVPLMAVSGIATIDSRNQTLVEKYSDISRALEEKQVAELLAKVTKTKVEISDAAVKKKVAGIRTECLGLRREVLDLGGSPLAEPLAYWRHKYELAPF